jgi:hypothetical protein
MPCTVCSLIKLNATVTSRLSVGNAVMQVSIFYCFHGAIVDSYRENLVVLGGELCRSSWEPGSDVRSTSSVNALYKAYYALNCITTVVWR